MPLIPLGMLMVGEFADGEIVIHHESWAKLTNLDSILLYSTRDRTLDSYDREFCLPQLRQPQNMAEAIEVVDQFLKNGRQKDATLFIEQHGALRASQI